MRKVLLIAIGIFGIFSSQAQTNKYGFPFITNYSPKTYQASEQNWAIVQDNRGVMYFGNNDHGVLEYDGKTWRKIPIDNNSIVRSLAKDSLGNIYVGAIGDFGVLKSNKLGNLEYKSLLYLVDSSARNFKDIWKIYVGTHSTYFCNTHYVFKLTNNEIETIQLPAGSFFSFLINDELLVGDYINGLKVLTKDSFVLVNNGQHFAQKGIYTIDTLDDELLIGTFPQGLFTINKKHELVENKLLKSKTNQFLKDNQLYCSSPYINGNHLFGTIMNGAILMDKEGNLLNHYNKQTGLQDETVINIYNDDLNNIWVALNKGISKIEQNNGIYFFSEKNGLKGSILDVCNYEKTLFVATTVGVFKLENTTGEPYFNPIEEISAQTWSLLPVEINGYHKLLVGTIKGLYEIDENSNVKYLDKALQKIEDQGRTNYIQKLVKSKEDNSLVYVCLRNGLFTIKWTGNKWKRERSIPVDGADIQSFAETDECIWLGTAFDGLIRLDARDHTKIERFNEEDGLPANKQIYVFEMNSKILFGTNKGVYQFDKKTHSFKPYTKFMEEYAQRKIGVFRICEDFDENIWVSAFNEDNHWIEKISQKNNYEYERDTLPFTRLPNEQYNVIYHDKHGNSWFGSSSGLYCYDNKYKRNFNYSYPTIIRSVKTSKDSILFCGTFSKEHESYSITTVSQPEEMIPKLDYSFNDLIFEFAAPYFIEEHKTLYSYQLEGYKDDWSKWSNEAKAVFTNLREGKYTFKVKAKNIYGKESDIAGYDFSIISPWYRSALAYIAYGAVVLALLYIIVKLYTKRLRKEKVKLEGIVRQRTAEVVEQKEEIAQYAEELKATNDRLVELDIFKQGMTGMIVHDLKNPLNAIINATDNRLSHYQKKVKQSGKQMLNMVMNILDVNKYEDAMMTVDKTEQNIYDIAQKAIYEVNFLAEQKNIAITNTINTVIGVFADKEIIERVLINLLTNAIKYTPQNGNVAVEATEIENGKLKISVVDTGQGIPKDQLSSIFEKFHQVKAKNSGSVRSTGLGLTFCKMAIEAHGGQIGVDAVLGEGSCFWFVLETCDFVNSTLNRIAAQVEEEKSKLVLSQEEKEQLKPFINDLKGLLVYETTRIEEVLRKIQVNSNHNLLTWIEEINNCLFTMNEEKYKELVNFEV